MMVDEDDGLSVCVCVQTDRQKNKLTERTFITIDKSFTDFKSN